MFRQFLMNLSFGVVVLFYNQSFSQVFYYSDNRQIPLVISSEKITAKFRSTMTDNQIQDMLRNEASVDQLRESQKLSNKFWIIPTKTGTVISEFIHRFKERPEVELANPVFYLNSQVLMAFDEFVVQFKESVDRGKIDALNAFHRVEIVREYPARIAKNYFVLKVTESSELDVLGMANLYFEDPQTEWAHPNFVCEATFFYSPSDPFFTYQYNFHNTGQTGGTADADIDALEAWDITTGSADRIIAVLDHGGTSHEDLPSARLVQGWDAVGDDAIFPNPDNDPTPDGDHELVAHGMACTGIIAASHNTIGIAGLSPNSKIMYIKITGANGFMNGQATADAIDFAWQNDADALSCSWRIGVLDNISSAINRALTQGRGGKGAVVVFAAGNNANRNANPPNYGSVSFPATVTGVLAVGATDKSNNIQYYSPRGSAIAVVAPSGNINLQGDIWTMDLRLFVFRIVKEAEVVR